MNSLAQNLNSEQAKAALAILTLDEAQRTNSSPRPNDRRFNPNKSSSTWQVTDCWELHHEIARRIFLGQKNVVIARELGCHPQTVSYVRNSEVVRKQIAEMEKKADGEVVDLRKQLAEKAVEALKVMETLMHDSKNDSVRQRCASDILDRAGYAPEKNINLRGTVAHLTGDDIAKIKELARKAQEAAAASGVITLTADEEGNYGVTTG